MVVSAEDAPQLVNKIWCKIIYVKTLFDKCYFFCISPFLEIITMVNDKMNFSSIFFVTVLLHAPICIYLVGKT